MFDLFQLPEEHQELRAAIRALAAKEIAPHAADVDENARFPQEAHDAKITQIYEGTFQIQRVVMSRALLR